MNERTDHLLEALGKLQRLRDECSGRIMTECGVSGLTARQVSYLRTINEEGEVTFTRLAEITQNSKPTITETINRFERMAFVYREPCAGDRRICYIRLTERGERIAKAESDATRRLIDRLVKSLDEEEQEILIRLLAKIR